MIQLTPEQSRALTEAEPVVVDPITKETYVLMRKAVLERMRAMLGDATQHTSAETLDRVMSEDDKLDPYLADLQTKYRDRL